ncbi:hypothetical protein JOF56_001988 [Kibdelosporangium banguiense]|uniref:ESX-1 secretion-associated protein n=1 Tax=Kibdelosporangium banguiense TaxID=1365924 RepID=A0ABS4TB07_9PSEU|nr:hypothetical protein [Kibdelosporangium banguiense]MBP2321603.1 hypothetical protein [Kibdelosporangium banguiense]
MAQTPKPMPGFSAPAAGLAPVAGQVEATRRKAEIDGLSLDPAAATALINTIARLRGRVDDLVGECAELDQPLKFGANFVGRTVAGRLQDTAAGSVTPVLTTFSQTLANLQAMVQAAAGRYMVTDEESARRMQRALSPFGLQADI